MRLVEATQGEGQQHAVQYEGLCKNGAKKEAEPREYADERDFWTRDGRCLNPASHPCLPSPPPRGPSPHCPETSSRLLGDPIGWNLSTQPTSIRAPIQPGTHATEPVVVGWVPLSPLRQASQVMLLKLRRRKCVLVIPLLVKSVQKRQIFHICSTKGLPFDPQTCHARLMPRLTVAEATLTRIWTVCASPKPSLSRQQALPILQLNGTKLSRLSEPVSTGTTSRAD